TEGYTWSYDYLWRVNSPKRFKNVEAFNFSIYDCAIEKGGFLTPEAIKDAEDKCFSASERRTRLHGEYQLVGESPAFPAEMLMSALERCQPGTRFKITFGPVAGGLSAPILEQHPEGDL